MLEKRVEICCSPCFYRSPFTGCEVVEPDRRAARYRSRRQVVLPASALRVLGRRRIPSRREHGAFLTSRRGAARSAPLRCSFPGDHRRLRLGFLHQPFDQGVAGDREPQRERQSVEIAAACKAPTPLPSSRAIATNPSKMYQNTRSSFVASTLPPAVVVSITSEPVSEEVKLFFTISVIRTAA